MSISYISTIHKTMIQIILFIEDIQRIIVIIYGNVFAPTLTFIIMYCNNIKDNKFII